MGQRTDFAGVCGRLPVVRGRLFCVRHATILRTDVLDSTPLNFLNQ
jgi:hypothetical protein